MPWGSFPWGSEPWGAGEGEEVPGPVDITYKTVIHAPIRRVVDGDTRVPSRANHDAEVALSVPFGPLAVGVTSFVISKRGSP